MGGSGKRETSVEFGFDWKHRGTGVDIEIRRLFGRDSMVTNGRTLLLHSIKTDSRFRAGT